MIKFIFTILLNCLMLTGAQAQFGSRVLKDELSKDLFVKLKYQAMNDSIVTGYGFPDPTSLKYIVFTKERPTEATTEDWETIKVKYAEFYYNKLAMQTREFYNLEYKETKSFLTDTLRAYYLRAKGGGIANGLEALSYENEKVRLFESIRWEGVNVYAELIYVQKKEKDPYNDAVRFLNYNSHKAFKRSAKRVFKDCPQLVKNIQDGAYFPKSKKHLKQLADDYESLCLTD